MTLRSLPLRTWWPLLSRAQQPSAPAQDALARWLSREEDTRALERLLAWAPRPWVIQPLVQEPGAHLEVTSSLVERLEREPSSLQQLASHPGLSPQAARSLGWLAFQEAMRSPRLPEMHWPRESRLDSATEVLTLLSRRTEGVPHEVLNALAVSVLSDSQLRFAEETGSYHLRTHSDWCLRMLRLSPNLEPHHFAYVEERLENSPTSLARILGHPRAPKAVLLRAIRRYPESREVAEAVGAQLSRMRHPEMRAHVRRAGPALSLAYLFPYEPVEAWPGLLADLASRDPRQALACVAENRFRLQEVLTPESLLPLLSSPDAEVRMQAMPLLSQLGRRDASREISPTAEPWVKQTPGRETEPRSRTP